MGKPLTKEQFILKARQVHGWKYDYSKVDYKDSRTKICIICPIHGEFWQLPSSHLCGNGCIKCRNDKQKLTTDWFIEQAREIHSNKYDYSKVKYVDAKTKVCIICHEKDEFGDEHGEFWQQPSHHLRGHGCCKCVKRHRYTIEEFVDKLKTLYGNKFDYSKVNYINTSTPVCLICHEKDVTGQEHGEFYPNPNNLLKGGMSCPRCTKNIKYTTEEWVGLMQYKYKDKGYDYSKVDYVDAKTKVCIICPKHGEFWQTPHSHDTGKGCPKCRTSTLEVTMENALKEGNINYIAQYKDIFKKNRASRQSLDFYLPDYNTGIECQGLQHFIKKWYSDKGEKKLTEIEERDIRKRKICADNGINLVYLYSKKDKNFVPVNDGYKYFDNPLELIDSVTRYNI